MASSFHNITIILIAIILTSTLAITATSQLTFFLKKSPPSTASSVTATMNHLYENGYKTLARSMYFHYYTLITLNNFTIFALDDLCIHHYRPHLLHFFTNGVMLYIVPNRFLKFQDLQKLPPFSALPTLIPGEFLYVTNDAGPNNDNGALNAIRINYNVIDQPDYFNYSNKVIVHGICLPFVCLTLNSSSVLGKFDGRSGYGDVRNEL